MSTLSELITEFAANPVAWVHCQCCGWIAIDAVVVKSETETNVKFYCPYCEKDSESLLAFGDAPGAPAASQEVTT
jgi:hypothetical protein